MKVVLGLQPLDTLGIVVNAIEIRLSQLASVEVTPSSACATQHTRASDLRYPSIKSKNPMRRFSKLPSVCVLPVRMDGVLLLFHCLSAGIDRCVLTDSHCSWIFS